MSNPYQPPSFDATQFQDQPAFPPGSPYGQSNWVNQVRTFAILNLVQGILELLFGLMISAAVAMFPFLADMEAVKKAQAEQGNPEQMFWVMGVVYLVIGIIALTSGILRIVAGVQNYRLKGRMLGIVSLIVGMAPVFTCYCAPTAIALLVFGLIIFLDPAVKSAFSMVKQGRTVSQVLAMFSPYQAAYPGPPQAPDATDQSPM
jgi:uncharacterized membrane protein HdeD (DUF308 family)